MNITDSIISYAKKAGANGSTFTIDDLYPQWARDHGRSRKHLSSAIAGVAKRGDIERVGVTEVDGRKLTVFALAGALPPEPEPVHGRADEAVTVDEIVRLLNVKLHSLDERAGRIAEQIDKLDKELGDIERKRVSLRSARDTIKAEL